MLVQLDVWKPNPTSSTVGDLCFFSAHDELPFSRSETVRQARLNAMKSLREKTDAKIEAVLAPDRKSKHEEMQKRFQEKMRPPPKGRTEA